MTLLSEGKWSKEIAELLFISTMTVQNHRANIKKKLRLEKNAKMVKFAIQKGYTPTAASLSARAALFKTGRDGRIRTAGFLSSQSNCPGLPNRLKLLEDPEIT